MATVNVNDSNLYVDSVYVSWLGLRAGGRLAPSLHSSNDVGELLKMAVVMMKAPLRLILVSKLLH